MNFQQFREKVQAQVTNLLRQEALFVTAVDRDEVYRLYLDSFPAGTNKIHIERTEHDCSACRQFIRTFGSVVAIQNNKLVSVWDLEGLESPYNTVANALSSYVKSMPIADQFLHSEAKVGIEKNIVLLENGTHTWTHLHAVLPSKFITPRGTSIGSAISDLRDRKNVFFRSLTELTPDSCGVVLDLIAQNSLYRGQEFKQLIELFSNYQVDFQKLSPEEQDPFCWDKAATLPRSVTKIRNSAIGTLLIDLSSGMELNAAVTKFEAIVAPANYKRPKAIFTARMLHDAEQKVTDLGFLNSLGRRFATIEDIEIQNILFANTDVMRQVSEPSVFSQMRETIPANPQQYREVEEVPIETFLQDVLPRVQNLEVLLENRHASNLVSIVGPQDSTAPTMFKWDNPYSWAYSGNITDSMKQRVKEAGGKVDGVLRFSIQWNEDGKNQNDFDAHTVEPNGHRIYYPNKRIVHTSSGILDVDIINPHGNVAVENITWSNLSRMPEGVYRMEVNTYSDRGGQGGFRAEIEFDGEIHSFDYGAATRTGQTVKVANVTFSRKQGFSIESLIDSSTATSSKTLWGKATNQFHPVTAMMLSPNYWDEQQGNGNRHYMFMLDGCINPETPNGFFNEFLRNDLLEHKRVFEALGGRMNVSSNDPKQLSGLGFSSTQRNSLVVRATGHTNRTIKITF